MRLALSLCPWAMLAALLSVAAGCTDNTTGVQAASAGQHTRFVGTVVDQETRRPLAAQVTICGVGSATTDAGGRFEIDVPAAIRTLLPMYGGEAPPGFLMSARVESHGYATQEGTVFMTRLNSDDGVFVIDIANTGVVEMRRGRSLEVVVSKMAVPLAGAHVYAYLLDFPGIDGGPSVRGDGFLPGSGCRSEIVGTTGANGIATLANLDPLGVYAVVVPSQDLDGVPGYDFGTDGTEHRIQDGGGATAIDVTPLDPGGGIGIVGDDLKHHAWFSLPSGPIADVETSAGFGESEIGSAARSACLDESVGFSSSIASASGAVTLVFDTPVTILTTTGGLEPRFQAKDNLVAPPPTAAGFAGFPMTTVTVTAAGSALDTIWTFTPTAALKAGEVYELLFFAQSKNDPLILSNERITGLHRPPLSAAIAAPALDNYNGTTGVTQSAAMPVYLEFAEVVDGSYKVLSITDESGERVISSPVTRSFIDGDDSMAYNSATAPRASATAELGATAGVRYRVQLRDEYGSFISLPDDAALAQRRVTLIIVAANVAGKTISEIVTLPVK